MTAHAHASAPASLPEELHREWASRGARWVGELGDAIVTGPGRNDRDFRRRVYLALGHDLPEGPRL